MANEHRHRVSRVAVLDSVILAVACLITFMLVTDALMRVYHLSRADDLIGLSVLVVYLIGRPGDAATAAITTAVVLVASAVTRSTPGSSRYSASPTR